MNILAFDTSGTKLTCAFGIDGSLSATVSLNAGLTHSEKLMPVIDQVLNHAGADAGDIDVIGCSSGPGSFTGLRIGMSTAKGLATALGAAVVSVPTLDLIAWGSSAECTVPIIDARKKRFYCAVYTANGQNQSRVTDYLDLSPEQIVGLLQQYDKPVLCGTDAPLFLEQVKSNGSVTFTTDPRQDAASGLIALTYALYKTNGPDANDAGPLYLRKSEAELSLLTKKSGQ